ncbi:MAG: putative membrane protein [Desulfovibrionaceae bacterium]|nr:MAG: putative membrane protein [Desulfovibrionaceae bacterium]
MARGGLNGLPLARLVAVRTLWAVSIAAVLWGSIVPIQLPLDTGVTWSDKVIHAGAYFWLAALGRLSLPRPNGGFWAFWSMFVLGWAIEVMQLYVPGREGSLVDGACNMFGIFAGLYMVKLFSPPLGLPAGGFSFVERRPILPHKGM